MRTLLGITGRKRQLAAVLVFLLSLALYASVASAHARLLRSQPAANSTLKQTPKSVELWFSEELEASMSTVTVTDQAGRRVDKNNVTLAEGDKKLKIELEELGSGTYTVDWRVLSTDQHTMKGQFTFTVAPGVAPPTQQPSAAPPQTAPSARQIAPTHGPAAPRLSTQESGSTLGMSLVRWLQYVAMMLLLGGFAFYLFVFAPAVRRARGLSETERAATVSVSARRIIFVAWLSLAALVVVSLAALVLQAAAVFDKGLGDALSPALLQQVITRTGFGSYWRLQAWATAALFVSLFFLSRRVRREATADQRALWWVSLSACAVLFIAPTLTGHAAVAAKEFYFARVADWLHLVAGGLWVGGLFHLALTMPTALSGLSARARLHVLHRVIPLFTRLSVASTVLVLLTGVYNSWMHVERFQELWSTPYGEALLLKVLLVIPMLALGGLNTFVIHPRASRVIEQEESGPDILPATLSRSFNRSVGVEAALGVAVLFVASVLVFLQPAREHPTDDSARAASSSVAHP